MIPSLLPGVPSLTTGRQQRGTGTGQYRAQLRSAPNHLPQLDLQILLIVTDPRHVPVRPQQHRGRVHFTAHVSGVVDPVRPPATESRPVWSSSNPRPPCISS